MSHIFGIPSLKRKNKPKGVKTEYARGGKVGRNSEGLKKYHACCRENSCGQTNKKKVESVKKKFQKEQKSKKEDLAKGQADAKKRLEERLKKKKEGKMDINTFYGKKKTTEKPRSDLTAGELRDQLVKNGYSQSKIQNMRKAELEKLPKKPAPAQKQRKRVFAKRRNKKEMAEARAMGMEDKDAFKMKEPERKPAKKPAPASSSAKTPFSKAKEFLWMKHILDAEADENYSEYISSHLRGKKEKEEWEDTQSLYYFSDKRSTQLINGLLKFTEAEVKKEYDKLTGKSDKEIRRILMDEYLGEQMDDDEIKDLHLNYY